MGMENCNSSTKGRVLSDYLKLNVIGVYKEGIYKNNLWIMCVQIAPVTI